MTKSMAFVLVSVGSGNVYSSVRTYIQHLLLSKVGELRVPPSFACSGVSLKWAYLTAK